MTYIGYTKSKKLKKLFILSRKIILAYGWNYFFFLVRHEFKKQGFSILSPDSAPQPSFLHENYQSEYIEYLKNIHHNLSKEFQTTNNTRSITVIILFDGNNQKLYHTIDSLKKQTHSNWNALILPLTLKSSKNIVEIDTTKIKKLDFTDNDKKLTDSLSSKSDFFCMLKAGNLLDQYGLSKILSIHDHDNSDLVYSDHDIIQDGDRTYPFFKPNWSPYLLRSTNFLSPLCIIKAQIFNKIRIESKFLNSIDYDILLKCIEITNKVFHVSLPLCSIEEVNSKKQLSSHKIVLQNHLNRIKINGTVKNGIEKNSFRVHYKLTSKPKVSILIPTRNNYDMIKRCIDSLEKKTNYSNKEILIIDNDSDCPKVKKYLQNIPYKIINYKGNFNFSKMNNFAAKQTSGDLLLFLNDDVKAIDSNWLDELVSICIQDDVGAVGPKLVFADSTIQHAGMVFLKTGAGFHPGMRLEKETSAYNNIINLMRDYSAVTGACLLVKKTVFDDVNGFDNDFDVYYGDSDLCLKIINTGFRIIYTPFTELLHDGSDTIQSCLAGSIFFDVENHQLFIKKWPYLKNGDPFYNSNLDWDYSISKNPFKLT